MQAKVTTFVADPDEQRVVQITEPFIKSLRERWERRPDIFSQAWFEYELLMAYAAGARDERGRPGRRPAG